MSSSKPLLFGDARIPGAPHRTMQRFMGHSNVHTDIKEATFIGGNDEMVAACSDDGHVFIYNAETGSPVSSQYSLSCTLWVKQAETSTHASCTECGNFRTCLPVLRRIPSMNSGPKTERPLIFSKRERQALSVPTNF